MVKPTYRLHIGARVNAALLTYLFCHVDALTWELKHENLRSLDRTNHMMVRWMCVRDATSPRFLESESSPSPHVSSPSPSPDA